MFKKCVAGIVAMAMVVPAFAGQDVYLTFTDGKTATYKNLSDDVNNDDLNRMLLKDFNKSYNDIDPSRSRIEETKFMDTGAGTAVKVVVGVILLAALVKVVRLGHTGCVNPWDLAKDGSRCGARASSVRPGGK